MFDLYVEAFDSVGSIGTYLSTREKTFAENKVSVGQVGEGLEKNLTSDVWVVVAGSQLIQLQHRKICVQIVRILLGLDFNVTFQCREIITVVPEKYEVGGK